MTETFESWLNHFNWSLLHRAKAPERKRSPWLGGTVHEDTCTCERCAHLHVNGHAPQEQDHG